MEADIFGFHIICINNKAQADIFYKLSIYTSKFSRKTFLDRGKKTQILERKITTINSRKYDGKIHRTWSAELVDETEELFMFVGVFDSEINHSILGVIRRGTISYEYYWKNRWFNIFRFHEPDGKFRNFYCNVNQPPILADGVLDYIDLDVDVLVWSDFSFEILDLDEFEQNIGVYDYPMEIQRKTLEGLQEVLSILERREFPFNFNI